MKGTGMEDNVPGEGVTYYDTDCHVGGIAWGKTAAKRKRVSADEYGMVK